MKAILAVLVLLGIGAYVIIKQRDETAALKKQLSELAEKLPEDERAQLYGAKPLVEDANVPRVPSFHKKVMCPQCKGEGAVMVRHASGGVTTDAKHMCGLCMGAGKREFDMVAGAEICSDCGGMGKRVLVRTGGASGNKTGIGGGADGGYADQAPTSTACPRCLGKGYFVRPGKK